MYFKYTVIDYVDVGVIFYPIHCSLIIGRSIYVGANARILQYFQSLKQIKNKTKYLKFA